MNRSGGQRTTPDGGALRSYTSAMAAYDYRCSTCDSVFTVERGMSEVATLTRCPAGHEDVVRVWSAVSVTGKALPYRTVICTAGPRK